MRPAPQAPHPGDGGHEDQSKWLGPTIAWYGRQLTWVLEHQRLTLYVAVATLVVTAGLYILIPKGFFPDQDTGLIQGISVATESISYKAMAERQQALAAAVLKDPDVVSLSSFIGVDGNNVTLNSGRFLINLKPRDQRSDRSTTSFTACKRRLRRTGHHPVHATLAGSVAGQHREPHAVPIHPRERQRHTLSTWTPKLVAALRERPELADVVSNLENNGLAAQVTIDRDTAARLGVSVGTVDNALYDAFGQRIVSTIFTQSNQYRVIIEADPDELRLHRFHPIAVCALCGRWPGSVVGNGQGGNAGQAAADQSPGAIPGRYGVLQPAPGASLGSAVDSIEAVEKSLQMPDSISTTFEGPRWRSATISPTNCCCCSPRCW